MLSPPYSPHSDVVDAQNENNGTANAILTRKGNDLRIRVAMSSTNALSALKSDAKSHTSSIRSTGSSATSSGSDVEDDDEEDITDDDNVIGSDESDGHTQSATTITTITSNSAATTNTTRDAISVSIKRSADEAFGKDAQLANVEEVYPYSDDADSESALVSPAASSEASDLQDSQDRRTPERRMTTCWDALRTNPRKYLRQERNLLDLYPLRRHSWAGPGSLGLNFDDSSDGNSASRTSSTAGASTATGGTGARRGRKPGRQPGGGRGRRRASVGLGNTSIEYGSRFSSRQGSVAAEGSADSRSQSGSESSGSASPSSSSSSVSGSSGGLRVHDLSYHQLEDYSPSVNSLPPGKSLRAEWKGAPMDLSGDPDLPLLHPAEAHLASVLRLPCDVYLDSKRRLFAEKVHRLKQGLPFRRTDSQKACRIDVNKASRLFGAFEKIGWLEDGLFVKYLKDS